MAEEETAPPRAGIRSRRQTLLLVAALVAVVAVAAVGTALLLTGDDWERTGPPIEVAGWAPYWQTLDAFDSFDANADVFGDVSIFGFHVIGDGAVVVDDRLADDAIGRFAARARPAGVTMLATISDETASGVMAGILADPTTRTAHVQAIVELVLGNGFDGVDIDYEQFAFADDPSTWETTRPNWVAFIRELTTAFHAQGKLVAVSVPSLAYSVYDHESIGEIVDRVKVMAYNFSTSAPGPIAPADWVRSVLDGLKDLVPARKIDLGIAVFGYDWPVSTSGTCPTDQEPGRLSVTPSSAAQLATEHGATVLWDEEAEEARFDYVDTLTGVDATGAAVTCTVNRTVRYLDARAIHRRAWIAHREDLHGVSIWALGDDDPTVWAALRTARDGVEEWPGPIDPPATAAATP